MTGDRLSVRLGDTHRESEYSSAVGLEGAVMPPRQQIHRRLCQIIDIEKESRYARIRVIVRQKRPLSRVKPCSSHY